MENMKISGFEWDDGNWPKCGKHGVSRAEIEQALLRENLRGRTCRHSRPIPRRAALARYRKNTSWSPCLSGFHDSED